MNINCITIDDEPLAHEVIADHCAKIPFLNLSVRVKDAVQAVEILEKEKIDLIFLDIQMPEMTGFELLQSLTRKPLVIFTTAYPDFAIQSYDIDAVDYLVKPIPFNRFLKAINKVKQRIGVEERSFQERAENNTGIDSTDYIFVKSEYKTIKILLSDILFIESQKDYVVFNLKDRKIMSLLNLSSVENYLPRKKFVRVHRSFIVAIDKIEAIERNIVYISGISINIGEIYRDNFNSIVENRKLI